MPKVRQGINYAFGTHQTMKVGRLQMIGRIHAQAGDSLAIQVTTNFRFAPLRRAAGVPVVTELFAFYLPYRWAYGDNFVTAAIEGFNSNQTYIHTNGADGPHEQVEGIPSLMQRNETIPGHVLNHYASIIDHHFKERHTAEVTSANVLTTEDDYRYGYQLWQLMSSWETRSNWADAHDEIMIDTDGGDQSALDLAHYVALGRDEQARTWDAVRREEVYQHTYGGKLSPEVEEEPLILMHQKSTGKENPFSMQGMELEQVNPAGLSSKISGRVPRRFIPEHGCIYLFACARIRPSYFQSSPYLDDIANFGNPRKLMGHPAGASMQPEPIKLTDLFADTTSSDVIGYVPYNEWLRTQPDWWSPDFQNNDAGWAPRGTPTSKLELRRHPDYSDIFATSQFGHGQLHSGIRVRGHRNLGMPLDSIQAPDMGRTERI